HLDRLLLTSYSTSSSPPASHASPPARPSVPTRRSSDLRAEQERINALTVKDLFDTWIADGVARMDGNAELKRLFGKDVHACHARSEEHTSELQSRENLVCRLLLDKKKGNTTAPHWSPAPASSVVPVEDVAREPGGEARERRAHGRAGRRVSTRAAAAHTLCDRRLL